MMRRSLTMLALLCACTGVAAKGGGGGGGHASSGHSSSHASSHSSSHATSAHSEAHGSTHTESHPVFLMPHGHVPASASSTTSANPQIASGTTGQTSDPDAPSYKLWIVGGALLLLLIAFVVAMTKCANIIDKRYGPGS